MRLMKISEKLYQILNKGIKCGLAIKPSTTWSELLPYLDLIDQVTIMTVEPGFGGQKFMSNQVDKIKNISDHIKLKNMNVEVEIDGGINFETGKTCVEAGADILVAGSFLFNQGDLISSTNKMSDNFN